MRALLAVLLSVAALSVEAQPLARRGDLGASFMPPNGEQGPRLVRFRPGSVLEAAGFRLIEVPLNSPDPFASIRRLADRFGPGAIVGAGTVLDAADVPRLADAVNLAS